MAKPYETHYILVKVETSSPIKKVMSEILSDLESCDRDWELNITDIEVSEVEPVLCSDELFRLVHL